MRKLMVNAPVVLPIKLLSMSKATSCELVLK